MAQPILAGRTPVACAACYGQYPDRLHVDFRAALEGAQVQGGPRAPHVDWVVICESCLRSGVALLPEDATQREQAERTIAALTERAEAAENYAASLEDTLSRRPTRERAEREPKAAPAKAARRPRYEAKAAS